MDEIYLYIIDPGDPNVGIFESRFKIEFPYLLDLDSIDEEDKENLELFREAILNAYKLLLDNPKAIYEFELINDEHENAEF